MRWLLDDAWYLENPLGIFVQLAYLMNKEGDSWQVTIGHDRYRISRHLNTDDAKKLVLVHLLRRLEIMTRETVAMDTDNITRFYPVTGVTS